jgi:hypothetical protein
MPIISSKGVTKLHIFIRNSLTLSTFLAWDGATAAEKRLDLTLVSVT